MIVQEGLRGETAGRQLHNRAYFLDLLGESHNGLGHPEAAIDAYRQAADAFQAEGAQCSYALCLFKIADCHLSLGEPWHAVGYLEACLPLLHDLGLTRHETLARHQLDACRVELAAARLLGEGRAGQRPLAERSRPALGTRRAETLCLTQSSRYARTRCGCCPRPAPCWPDARVIQIPAAVLAVAGAPAARTGSTGPCPPGRFWMTLPGRSRRSCLHGGPTPLAPSAGRPALAAGLHNVHCRRIGATRVDSCYARDRRTAALADS